MTTRVVRGWGRRKITSLSDSPQATGKAPENRRSVTVEVRLSAGCEGESGTAKGGEGQGDETTTTPCGLSAARERRVIRGQAPFSAIIGFSEPLAADRSARACDIGAAGTPQRAVPAADDAGPAKSKRGRLRSVAAYDQEIARNQRLRSRALDRERQKDRAISAAEKKARNRRMVILGASVLQAAKRGDSDARRLVAEALEHLRPGDKAPFEAWTPEWEKSSGESGE